MTMIFYCIRHKQSGELMPQFKRGRGYSHWNPNNPEWLEQMSHVTVLKVPRLLESRKKAHNCIVQWAVLPNAVNTYDHDGEADIDIKPDGRKKEDLEVVEVELSL